MNVRPMKLWMLFMVLAASDASAGIVQELQAQIAALSERVDVLEADNTGLQSLLAGVSRNGDTLVFGAMNLQIVNGLGATDGDTGGGPAVNGLGNLIIGYDELSPLCENICAQKSGSHNLVVGPEHIYTSYGALLAGSRNTVSAPYGSVSGGFRNSAEAPHASVSGGSHNQAEGEYSAIGGGSLGTVQGTWASIFGGEQHYVTGQWATAAGGYFNLADGDNSTALGGNQNNANGSFSTVTGGRWNTADGSTSSVSGGDSRTAAGTHDWVAGGLFQDD